MMLEQAYLSYGRTSMRFFSFSVRRRFRVSFLTQKSILQVLCRRMKLMQAAMPWMMK